MDTDMNMDTDKFVRRLHTGRGVSKHPATTDFQPPAEAGAILSSTKDRKA